MGSLLKESLKQIALWLTSFCFSIAGHVSSRSCRASMNSFGRVSYLHKPRHEREGDPTLQLRLRNLDFCWWATTLIGTITSPQWRNDSFKLIIALCSNTMLSSTCICNAVFLAKIMRSRCDHKWRFQSNVSCSNSTFINVVIASNQHSVSCDANVYECLPFFFFSDRSLHCSSYNDDVYSKERLNNAGDIQFYRCVFYDKRLCV